MKPIVQITTDQMDTMQVEIVSGVKKENSSLQPMTDYMSDFWDGLVVEINNMGAGAVLDLRPEIPSP